MAFILSDPGPSRTFGPPDGQNQKVSGLVQFPTVFVIILGLSIIPVSPSALSTKVNRSPKIHAWSGGGLAMILDELHRPVN